MGRQFWPDEKQPPVTLDRLVRAGWVTLAVVMAAFVYVVVVTS